MHTIKNTSLPPILLLLLCIHPLQAAHNLLIESKHLPIDAAPASDYQLIAEKGVDKFEEYLLMLQKKCIETEKIKKGLVLLVGTTGSGKSTLICHLMGVGLVGIRNDASDDSDDSDDEDDEAMSYACIDIDPNNLPNFPVPKIGHDLAHPQTFLPGVFSNSNVKNGLNYCDMPGFHDRRGAAEAAIAAIAPALVLHSTERVQAVLAVLSYDNITSCRGEKFLQVITDVMAYFKHAPWDRIQKATFVCITKCARVSNKDAKKAIKDQIRDVARALEKKLEKYNKAIDALKAHHAKGINLDKQEKEAYEDMVADYEALRYQAKFFSIFAAMDIKTKKIVLYKNKFLFSRPLHKNRKKYRTKIIEALKNSPGLEKKHLSKCDYSNPTLTKQLTKIVGRMGDFLSTREDLKTQNKDLQKSISNKTGIPQQIKMLKYRINATSLKLSKESTNTSLVAIYRSSRYHCTFSRKKKLKHWCFFAALSVAAWGGASWGHACMGNTVAQIEINISSTAVVEDVEQDQTMLKKALGGMKNYGNLIVEPVKLAYYATRPCGKISYSASEPVYVMRVYYGAGTFKSTGPNGLNVHSTSPRPSNHFIYRATNVSTDYPLEYVFEYMGYFHTDGHCEFTLYSKYNELKATKQRMQTLASSIRRMQETIKTIKKDRKSKVKKIASNRKEIERLDGCIMNTYEKREKNQDIAYARSKCAMLEFFASKPLFNKGASLQMNNDSDKKEEEKELKKEEKETDHPLLANMNRCITQWKAWLCLANGPPLQADADEQKHNNHQSVDNEVFDID